jgi:hypothetical protein
VRLGVIALCEEAVGDPHLGSRAVEELGRHDLAARRCNYVSHGRSGDERPLPVRLALDARRRSAESHPHRTLHCRMVACQVHEGIMFSTAYGYPNMPSVQRMEPASI